MTLGFLNLSINGLFSKLRNYEKKKKKKGKGKPRKERVTGIGLASSSIFYSFILLFCSIMCLVKPQSIFTSLGNHVKLHVH